MFAAGKTDGVAAVAANYIEDVFSSYLWTGNASSQTITNGIDLSTKGGMVWIKARSSAIENVLLDTTRGIGNYLVSNNTDQQIYVGNILTSVLTNGFDIGSSARANSSGVTYASWTFREQAKFFDVVTYTGNGSAGRTLSHSLASQPGFILIKRTDGADPWLAFARLNGTDYSSLRLNTTAAGSSYTQSDIASSTVINVGYINSNIYSCNVSSETYVAYLFAHDAGGFGLTGTDNVISCGTYTGTGSPLNVTLGYEPQWLLVKKTSATGDWILMDTMRGMSMTTSQWLYPNAATIEDASGTQLNPTATGFTVSSTGSGLNGGGATYIYVAIRRGPMKVPTSGTSVYESTAYTGNGASNRLIGSSVLTDLLLLSNRDATSTNWSNLGQGIYDRLRGQNVSLATSNTNTETSGWLTYFNLDMNTGWDTGNTTDQVYLNKSSSTYVSNAFRRAPSFMDVVCWTSNDTYPQVLNHNLTVAPELIIRKPRSISDEWAVGFNFQTSSYKKMALNTTAAQTSYGSYSSGEFPGKPTATQFTDQGSASGRTFVAYLFATCAGVSKVGSYTGNGSTQTINCGFTGGARFVLIKRTDATGDWYVYDTARGMTVLTDPYLQLNSTAAETATLGSVTTVSTGFALDSTILAAINVSSGTYIFLAIA